ncbi:MAG: hypothetical protein EBZ77_11940, partial [Chitinophagia bacterium]|nr:hypothetical protein [Chitinophagia bacterium]
MHIRRFALLLALLFWGYQGFSFCSVSISSNNNANFTSISASGAGVTSTISVSVSACTGGFSACSSTYSNLFSSQGITAPTGSSVTISATKASGYTSYLFYYIDWDNDGNFVASEQVGSTITWGTSGASVGNTFTVPLRGIVTNTSLHMRAFNAETYGSGYSAPCTAVYGDCYDFYFIATCSTPTISTSISSATICGSGSIPVTASSSLSGTQYEWSPATALSATTGASITASPTASTTYTVTGFGPGVCEASTTVPITYIAFGPTPVISVTGATTVCSGTNVTLSEVSGAALAYQWYAGASAIPGATNSTVTVRPFTTTTYSVVITTTGGCTSSTTQTITVDPTPNATVAAIGATTVCAPNSVRINASPTGGGFTYAWYNAGTATGTTTSSYNASVSGTYSVVVTSSAGCADTSAPITITVNPKPTATATSTSPLTVCDYDNVTLTGGAGFASYQWLNGTTPIAGATNRVYVSNVPGTYNYRLQVSNGSGCLDTTGNGLFRVTVVASPSSTITHSTPLTFCVGSNVVLTVPSGNTYQWYYGTTATSLAPMSGATNATYTASITGYYAVVVTNSAGCTTNSLGSPVLVTAVPNPYIVYSGSTTFCWGSSITLSINISSAATGVIYQWKLNGANIPGANGNSYAANATGDYTCFVNISGSCA